MRAFGTKKTHSRDGQELSEIFVDEDGVLSIYLQDDEYEIVGGVSSILADALMAVPK